MGGARPFQFSVAVTVICFVIIRVSYANGTEERIETVNNTRALNEILQEAFAAFYDEVLYKKNVINDDRRNVARDFWDQFYLNEARAIQELDSSLETSLEIIDDITTTAVLNGLNVSRCVDGARNDLLDFAQQLNSTLNECLGRSIMEGNDFIEQAWASVNDVYESTLQCTNRSIVECTTYQDNEECLEFVLNVISENKQRLLTSLDYLQVVMLNVVKTFTYPCRNLFVNQMGLYPSLITSLVNSCISNTATSVLPNIC